MLRTTFLLLAVLAACGGSQPTAKTSAAPAPALGIADLKFYEGDHLVAQLHADGSFEIARHGQLAKVGTITADGTITGKDGKAAKLKSDGTLEAVGAPSPDSADLRLEGEVMVVQGEKKLFRMTVDASGAVLADGKPFPGKPLRVEGTLDANTRRTALLVFGLMTDEPVETTAVAPVVEHTGAFLVKLADAMDASGGDCDKLAAGMQALAPDAKALRAELVAAHMKLDDMKEPPPGVEARFAALKNPAALEKCNSNAGVKQALDATLWVIAPLEENSEFVKAFADAFGKAMAPH